MSPLKHASAACGTAAASHAFLHRPGSRPRARRPNCSACCAPGSAACATTKTRAAHHGRRASCALSRLYRRSIALSTRGNPGATLRVDRRCRRQNDPERKLHRVKPLTLAVDSMCGFLPLLHRPLGTVGTDVMVDVERPPALEVGREHFLHFLPEPRQLSFPFVAPPCEGGSCRWR